MIFSFAGPVLAKRRHQQQTGLACSLNASRPLAVPAETSPVRNSFETYAYLGYIVQIYWGSKLTKGEAVSARHPNPEEQHRRTTFPKQVPGVFRGRDFTHIQHLQTCMCMYRYYSAYTHYVFIRFFLGLTCAFYLYVCCFHISSTM